VNKRMTQPAPAIGRSSHASGSRASGMPPLVNLTSGIGGGTVCQPLRHPCFDDLPFHGEVPARLARPSGPFFRPHTTPALRQNYEDSRRR